MELDIKQLEEIDLKRIFGCKHDENWIILCEVNFHAQDDGCSNDPTLYYGFNAPVSYVFCEKCGLPFKNDLIKQFVDSLEVNNNNEKRLYSARIDKCKYPLYNVVYPSNFNLTYNFNSIPQICLIRPNLTWFAFFEYITTFILKFKCPQITQSIIQYVGVNVETDILLSSVNIQINIIDNPFFTDSDSTNSDYDECVFPHKLTISPQF